MSIYFEFPAIAEYPLYPDPFRNDQEVLFPEKGKLIVEVKTDEAKDQSDIQGSDLIKLNCTVRSLF